ncbi:thioredoxin domain-containing protein [Haloglomus litoreum]|uniref:thioredoxin domain-containing protein n=1 Tax=Haloglomus litoreum TaxID=3034026 RepID=UPI0023E8701D|nr:thioredoxin domain-containing protein [Haloglomus sp. DT116]
MPTVDRNRLDDAASPYLQQHADNPVNWQPWDDEALAAAREQDVPVFLSVGYSACHWCHVMEEESFEDDEVAGVLNESFVPIKVDREERPDIDSLYITVCQLVRGQAGWPLSVFLTPEGKPFYVGTYFPKEATRGQPGFLQLLRDVRDNWSDPEEREEIEDRAEQWAAAARGELEDVPDQPGTAPDAAFLDAAASAALRSADRQHGGFGQGQKFPQPGRLHVLLRAHDRAGRDTYREVVEETLDAMANNGLYDHLGGGFHRYCVDRSWTVPHFEKMLYDNAEIPRAFLAGYQVTGEERYAAVVRETFAFLDRELRHPDGGFYATLDARSPPLDGRSGEAGELEEGAFYAWTPDEVRAALDTSGDHDDLDADLLCDRFGVTGAGNFEAGLSVLTRAADIEVLAGEYGLDTTEVSERLDASTRTLREARADRPRPRRDEKVLAGWNGLAIAALAEGALVLEDDRWAGLATDALDFVRDRLWDADGVPAGSADGDSGEAVGRLQRRWKDGDAGIDGYLEDYAFLGRGALACYEATGGVEHLAFALDLARCIEASFWDADRGTLYFTPAGGESLVARPQELGDSSTPSSAGVATSLLAALDGFVDHDRFGDVAEAVVGTHASTLESNPLKHPTLTLAADDVAVGPLELTIASEDDLPDAWRATLARTYLPGRLLAPRPATDDALAEWLDTLGGERAPPIWADRGARDGEPTVYACRSRTCSPPTHDLAGALEWAADLGPGGSDPDGGE